MSVQRIELARELMVAHAARTGVGSARTGPRYLWTDAFALCNWLGLSGAAPGARGRALALVDDVHRTLGRHRGDDAREGWLSGPAGSASDGHPTRGGLRIGKSLPERAAGAAPHDREEWERDGQYFHYLTRWMHALDQLARATGEPRYNRWARELAITAHRAFVYRTDGGLRMYWKMSIDLSRPQVASMGHHDPLDGYVSALQLREGAAALGSAGDAALDACIADYAAMLGPREWATPDPLGIGGLLVDATRVAQLARRGAMPDAGLLGDLLRSALRGLRQYLRGREYEAPAQFRLGFRELGLAIGLAGVARLHDGVAGGNAAGDDGARATLAELHEYEDMGARIESFWLDPAHRRVDSWTTHRDINEVMLATRLAPEGCLLLQDA